MTSAEQLYGTWDLVAFVRKIDGKQISEVLGPKPVGRLSYQPDGRITALLMDPDREWPEGAEFLRADNELRGAAALGFAGYGGWFEVRGDQVVHHVDISLYPDHVGTDLVRTMRWEGEQLTLVAPELRTRSGRAMWDELTWQRFTRRP